MGPVDVCGSGRLTCGGAVTTEHDSGSWGLEAVCTSPSSMPYTTVTLSGRGKGRPTQAPGINIFIYFAMLGSESWAFCLLDSSTTEPHP